MMDKGFMYASCAMSFFRNRHGKKPRFKKSKRNYDVPVYKDHVRMVRHFIRKAREAGFVGSVKERIMNGEHLKTG